MTPTAVLLLVLASGAGFGTSSLITKACKLQFLAAGFTLQLGTLLIFLSVTLLGRNHFDLTQAPELSKGLALGLLAGMVNGLGQLAYQVLVAAKDIEISRFLPSMLTTNLVIIVLGGWIAFGEPVTLRKLMGIATAILTIHLILGGK